VKPSYGDLLVPGCNYCSEYGAGGGGSVHPGGDSKKSAAVVDSPFFLEAHDLVAEHT